MRAISRYAVAAALLAAGIGLHPAEGSAQAVTRRWEPAGFDFSPDGVWRPRARRVADQRRAALARGDFAALNAAPRGGPRLVGPGGAASSAMMLGGTMRIPIFLVRYKNSPGGLAAPSMYHDALLGVTAPAGRPYSLRSFYSEMSNGLLDVDGLVIGWIQLDSNDTWYEGPNNGLNSLGRVAAMMAEAVAKSDTIDFSQFDNDGADGIPNSADDDGFVDVALFVHPERGGECGPSTNRNIWSHRFFYEAWTGGSPLLTNDVSTGTGGNIRVNNYTIQSGVGGATACDETQLMAPGTTAHELGHGLGLPDLYDTNPADGDDSEGIGHWGLMGAGNYARPLSPAHMEGFSRMTLGWVTVRDITTNGSYTLGAYTVSDTVFRIVPSGPNPRNEYFLIENRQGALADTALIGLQGGGGLLIWHLDAQQYNSGRLANRVNSGPIHGVALMQADGLNQLRSSTQGVRNRGDGGDPFPGASGNAIFSMTSNPSAALNNGGAVPFLLDSIRQVVPAGEIAFRLRMGVFTLSYAVSGSGTVTPSPAIPADGYVPQGDSITLTAVPGPGQTLVGWFGDTTAQGTTLVLRMMRPFSVTATFQAPLLVADTALRAPVMGLAYQDTIRMSGGVGVYTAQLLAGSLPPGLSLTPGGVFLGTPARDSTWNFVVRMFSGAQYVDLALRLTVTAPTLVMGDVVNELLLGGSHLTTAERTYLDLLGNRNAKFDVGDFTAWLDVTGNAVSAEVMGRVMAGSRR